MLKYMQVLTRTFSFFFTDAWASSLWRQCQISLLLTHFASSLIKQNNNWRMKVQEVILYFDRSSPAMQSEFISDWQQFFVSRFAIAWVLLLPFWASPFPHMWTVNMSLLSDMKYSKIQTKWPELKNKHKNVIQCWLGVLTIAAST